MNWISVKVRLPINTDTVLITDGKEMTIGTYDADIDPRYGRWNNLDESEWATVDERITHWMPMPAFPEQDTKENSL
jgi:hypothetical protein